MLKMYDKSLKKQKSSYEQRQNSKNSSTQNNYGFAAKSINNNLSKSYGFENSQKSISSVGTGQKKFKSSYLNDNGKWSIKAVDDGLVDFEDYIGDIKDESTTYPSYNNRSFKVTEDNSRRNNYNPVNISKTDYELDGTEPKEEVAFFSGAKEKIDAATDFFLDHVEQSGGLIGSGTWAARNLGVTPAIKGYEYSQSSLSNAEKKAMKWGLDSTWNNKADAFRHFIWNAEMTRDSDVGYYNARNIGNRHEYETMRDSGWLADDSSGFDYKKDNTIIKGRMDRENLMDLWNNQVGRELANNKDFAHMTKEELFEHAIKNDWLITDAEKVYDFLGISDYVDSTKTVDTEWDLTTGNVTVKKDGESVTLKIGV